MQSYQTDWEALLSRSPAPFIASVSSWMYPVEARASGTADNGGGTGLASSTEGQAAAAQSPPPPLVDALPAVKELLPTLRARQEALNGPKAPPIHMK